MVNDDLYFIENTLGYKFRNINLLYQAFVSEKFAAEHGGENNRVLIYIGRKALEYNTARYITEWSGWYSSMPEGSPFRDEELREYGCDLSSAEINMKSEELLSDKALAARFDDLGFASFRDEKENSAKAELLTAAAGAAAVDCGYDGKILYDISLKIIVPDRR